VSVAARRRRDRRGRGVRGPLLPGATAAGLLPRPSGLPRPLPAAKTRAERFDDHVLAAVAELEERWGEELERVEFVVELVPTADLRLSGVDAILDEDDPVPLAHLHLRGRGRDASPPRIVIFRRPVEARALDAADASDLVLDVVVHEVARLLGLTPEEVDPEGHGPDD